MAENRIPESQHGPSRRTLLAGGAAAVAALGIGVPYTVAARHDRTHATRPGPAVDPAAPGRRVAARQGTAYQLMSSVDSRPRPDHAAARAVAATAPAFALALLDAVPAGGDVALSPASLAIALAMLQNGARGDTLAELLAALRADHLTSATLDAGWGAITDGWDRAHGVELASANSIWAQAGLPVDAGFLAALRRSFGAGVWQADFERAAPAATRAIDSWTSAHTHGRIPKLLDSIPTDTRMVLVNALYFTAPWATPFEPADTRDGAFGSGPDATRASFMSAQQILPVARTADCTAVQLPYRGDRFAALALLPARGDLHQYVGGLSAAKLAGLVGSLAKQPVALRIPRFAITSSVSLVHPLHALGMHRAFSPAADFSGLSAEPLQVSDVIQQVYLSVAEKGTEAAAATGIVMQPTGAMPAAPISFDRPFVFLVRDTTTGVIVFAARVVAPKL